MQSFKPVIQAPTLSMPRGKAWRLDLRIVRANNPPRKEDAAVDVWLVEAPWAHPAWHSYLITLIHLRPIEGTPPPVLLREFVSHEILVLALEPQGDRDRLLVEGTGQHCRVLSPQNYAGQFTEIEDALAQARVRYAVEQICTGNLSPDSDFRAQWVALFGPDAREVAA